MSEMKTVPKLDNALKFFKNKLENKIKEDFKNHGFAKLKLPFQRPS